MGAIVHSGWLSRLLGLLPAPLLAALDAWSYRVAQRHLERRRMAGRRVTGPAA